MGCAGFSCSGDSPAKRRTGAGEKCRAACSHRKMDSFLDSDDCWADNGLQLIAEKIKLWPEEKLFVTKWLTFSQQSECVPNASGLSEYFTEGPKTFSTIIETIQAYEKLFGWAIWKLVIHRSLICDTPLLFLPNVRNGEDLYWGVHLFCRCRNLCFLNVYLCCYRVQNTGTLSELSAANALNWMTSIFQTASVLAERKDSRRAGCSKLAGGKICVLYDFGSQERAKRGLERAMAPSSVYIESRNSSDDQQKNKADEVSCDLWTGTALGRLQNRAQEDTA